MLTEQELLAAYAQGYGTSHLEGLLAVQAAILAKLAPTLTQEVS